MVKHFARNQHFGLRFGVARAENNTLVIFKEHNALLFGILSNHALTLTDITNLGIHHFLPLRLIRHPLAVPSLLEIAPGQIVVAKRFLAYSAQVYKVELVCYKLLATGRWRNLSVQYLFSLGTGKFSR